MLFTWKREDYLCSLFSSCFTDEFWLLGTCAVTSVFWKWSYVLYNVSFINSPLCELMPRNPASGNTMATGPGPLLCDRQFCENLRHAILVLSKDIMISTRHRHHGILWFSLWRTMMSSGVVVGRWESAQTLIGPDSHRPLSLPLASHCVAFLYHSMES